MALILSTVGGLAGAAACGAPRYAYVADGPASTYFKVPWGWHAVPASALASAMRMNGSGAWLSAYGKDSATASPVSVYSFDVGEPFVLAEVGGVSPQASGQISYDALTDIFLPVTPGARSQTAGELPVTSFRLLRQSTLTPGQGVRGVRVTYDYTWTNGSRQGTTDTFDQVAFTNANRTKVYLLIAHCTSACYSQNKNAINDIVSSFTVRSPL